MKKILTTLAIGVFAVNAFAVSQLFINDFDFDGIAPCYVGNNGGVGPLAGDWVIEVEGGTDYTQMYLVSEFYNEFSITYEGVSDLHITMYACDWGIGASFTVPQIIDDENAHYLWEFPDIVPDFCDATLWCEEEETAVVTPDSYRLHENYPNPFNPATTIKYDLVNAGHVELTVYNLTGETVATLVNGEMPAGFHTVNFDASNLASGVYFYRINAGDFEATHKMTLIK